MKAPVMRDLNRRSVLVSALTMAAAFNASCSEKNTMMSFVVYNYWPRPIADVFVDGAWAGQAPEKLPGRESGGGGGTVGPVSLKTGKKTVKWTLDGPLNSPRFGEVVTATFDLVSIGADHRYAAVHVYPDATVFIETSKSIPEERPKK